MPHSARFCVFSAIAGLAERAPVPGFGPCSQRIGAEWARWSRPPVRRRAKRYDLDAASAGAAASLIYCDADLHDLPDLSGAWCTWSAEGSFSQAELSFSSARCKHVDLRTPTQVCPSRRSKHSWAVASG
jgi:hypothetical protein